MKKIHDTGYKKLFKSPVLVEELVTHFVMEDWIGELDFSSLELLDKTFITDEFKTKESDMIYKVSFRGKDVYIFLLIEFQSTVDRFMSLRVLRYITEFYEFLYKSRKLKKLPPVFPLLLYNGRAKWNSPLNIMDLVEGNIPLQYIPRFQYYCIAENNFSKKTLRSINNVVSALFYVENSIPEELLQEIDVVVEIIKKENPREIELFKNWIFYIFNRNSGSRLTEEIQRIQEVPSMFAQALEEYGEKLRKKAKREGHKEGEKQALLQSAKNMMADGVDTLSIIKYTGLSKEEIENL
jgi:predicted transposase/invertase (TIGR01784 family)